MQHTRTVVALTFVRMCLESFMPEPDSDVGKFMKKIDKAVRSCAVLTRKKRLSAGAKRDLQNCSIIAGNFVDQMNSATGCNKFIIWAAMNWMALTFVEDAIVICKNYTGGIEAVKWQKLKELLTELTDTLLKLEDGIDERGTYMYEKCSWALDGIVFKDERETEFC